MSHAECWKLFNISTNHAVDIFRVNVYWLGVVWRPHIGQALRGEWNVMDLIGYYPIGDEHVVEEKR
jgi:hypothetical protein